MSAIDAITLTCDWDAGCLEMYTDTGDPDVVRAYASEAGWESDSESNRDICPKHAAEADVDPGSGDRCSYPGCEAVTSAAYCAAHRAWVGHLRSGDAS